MSVSLPVMLQSVHSSLVIRQSYWGPVIAWSLWLCLILSYFIIRRPGADLFFHRRRVERLVVLKISS